MSNRKFNATVTTTALNGSTVELQDTMIFSGVDQKFVNFLTGSCKLAVGFLMRLLPSMAREVYKRQGRLSAIPFILKVIWTDCASCRRLT